MRDTKTRKADVLAALERHADVWLSTADPGAAPHVIAVAAWWDGTDLVVATQGTSRTARNLASNPVARVASGSPADAIVIGARVVESRPAKDAVEMASGFAAAVGWNPADEGEGWVFFRLRPFRIQAYRGYEELEGRDVMKGSRWLA
jgi:hypothetical protein